MKPLPFLFDCSYKRNAKGIICFCLAHAAIAFLAGIVVALLSHSANLAKQAAFAYLSYVTILPVMQKRLHGVHYSFSFLSIVLSAIGGVVLGILPVAYLMTQPRRS